jgi:hypothetical protein
MAEISQCDFDKCLPYFVDNETSAICLAVCPWSRPGLAEGLVVKMARKTAVGWGVMERRGCSLSELALVERARPTFARQFDMSEIG